MKTAHRSENLKLETNSCYFWIFKLFHLKFKSVHMYYICCAPVNIICHLQ